MLKPTAQTWIKFDPSLSRGRCLETPSTKSYLQRPSRIKVRVNQIHICATEIFVFITFNSTLLLFFSIKLLLNITLKYELSLNNSLLLQITDSCSIIKVIVSVFSIFTFQNVKLLKKIHNEPNRQVKGALRVAEVCKYGSFAHERRPG